MPGGFCLNSTHSIRRPRGLTDAIVFCNRSFFGVIPVHGKVLENTGDHWDHWDQGMVTYWEEFKTFKGHL